MAPRHDKRLPARVTAKQIAELPTLAEGLLNGDMQALEKLQRIPEAYEGVVEQYKDLAQQVESELVLAFAGKDLILREALKRRMAERRAELLGPNPSPLESILVERVVCCWFHTQVADAAAVRMQTHVTLEQWEYYLRRQDRTTRRFLHACKALAQVRRLLGPNIQVNVAEKQINIMAATASEGT